MVTFESAVDRAVIGLVSVRHDANGSFVSTPLIYPSGSSVMVWIRRASPHFVVSDFGFAYRECALMGADTHQFHSLARSVADAAGVLMRDDAFEIMSSEEQLVGAIRVVANCSQEAALRFAHRLA